MPQVRDDDTPDEEIVAVAGPNAIRVDLFQPYDPVRHPAHYTRGKIEVWDFIVDQGLNFLEGNVIKYICRAGKKDPQKHLEDLNKAKAYLEREIKRISDNATDF